MNLNGFQAGSEWIVDALGCHAGPLADPAVMRCLCERIIDELHLQVVGSPQWHTFPGPGGVTGLYLLTESHLACHTFPERGLATFNLYCCRPHGPWPWRENLTRDLEAAEVRVQMVQRGCRQERVAHSTVPRDDEGGAAHASSARENVR